MANTQTGAGLTATDFTVGRRKARNYRKLVPWAFLAGPLLLAFVFKVWPAIQGLWMSLNDVQPLLGNQFVGLKHYVAILSDSRFLDAIGHTVFLAVMQTVGAVVFGLIFALLFEGSARHLQIMRSVVFLPVVTAVAVVGEAWKLVYAPSGDGLLNMIGGFFGLSPAEFISDPSTALFWVGVVEIWINAPYDMLIFLAGLVGIDRELYESAAIDGAGRFRRLWSVVLPNLRASLSVVLTLSAIRGLRVFTEVFVLTGGGPAGSTETWLTRVFSIGFDAHQIGLASAGAMILLLLSVVLTVGVRWISARKLASK